MLTAVAALLLLVQAAGYPDCLTDDAFISFRYARHLAEGRGLAFNPGLEPPVEGYTNLLWTTLLAATTRAGVDPEPAARAFGLAFGLGAMVATTFFCRRLLPDSPWAWPVPALLLASNSFFALEAVQGLETTCSAFLITAGLAAWAGAFASPGQDSQPALAAVSGILLALAALTRPEAIALAAAAAAVRAVHLARHRRAPGSADALWLLLLVLPVAAQIGFRLWYYGDWLPNTFYAKTGGGIRQMMRGWQYLSGGLARLAPWVALAAIGIATRLRRNVAAPRLALATLTLVWACSAGIIVAVGGDFKPTYRFIACTAPLLALLAATGLASASRGLAARTSAMATGVTLTTLLAGTLAWTWVGTAPARQFAAQREKDLVLLREAAAWFSGHLAPDSLIATGPSGAIPYYTDLPTLDMWGLNDREIGRRVMPDMGAGSAGHEKGDGAAVLRRRPDVILFTAARFTPEPLPESALQAAWLSVSERELLALSEFHARYRWRSVRLPSATLNFYERISGATRS